MKKTKQTDADPFGECVTWAWVCTKKEQRKDAFEDWVNGQKTHHLFLADLLDLDPQALLLACLLEFEHESVCNTAGRPLEVHFGKLRDRMVMWKPVDNCIKSVDNYMKSVEKSVENAVDKMCSYPQIKADQGVLPHPGHDLSTFPQSIHISPVDKSL